MEDFFHTTYQVKQLNVMIQIILEDLAVYCEVREDVNAYSVALQNDLNTLDVWYKTWQLNLNKDKCLVMRISRKRERSVPTQS